MYGVYVGLVTDNKDPDGKYRVKVRIPSQDNGDASGEQTFWYRVCTFGAGKILVQHSSANTTITLLSSDIKIESSGDTIVNCDNFKVTAKTNIELKSSADTKITASA